MIILLSGIISNLLDNIFYGLIFDRGTIFNEKNKTWIYYTGISKINFYGYSSIMRGCVVDMFQLNLINSYLPEWIPFFGGKKFNFFKPTFNLADFFIFIGYFLISFFYKKAFK